MLPSRYAWLLDRLDAAEVPLMSERQEAATGVRGNGDAALIGHHTHRGR